MKAVGFRSAQRVPETEQTRRHRPDYLLVILALLLTAIGLIVVYSISPALSATRGGSGGQYVSKQVIAIVLSIIAFFVTARVPLDQWRRWQKPLIAIAAVGTLIALVTPVNAAYPAHRWIRAGGFSLQSVEILKFALIICVASFLARRAANGEVGDTQKTLKPMAYVLLLITIIVAGPAAIHGQSDLGSFGVILAMVGAMAIIAGLPKRHITIVGAALGILIVAVIAIAPYRLARLTTFLHPSCTTGYQACQALIAVGSGGINGLGLGQSVQAYGYLPEAQNDSIFAIYAEKFGFIGVMVLLGLFTVLFARLRTIAERAPDMFSRLIVTAILAWLSTQMIINVGAMIGLLPLKGITLPFVSYGGTSVLFVGAALGLVFQISHYTSFGVRRSVAASGQRPMNIQPESNRLRSAARLSEGRQS